MKPIPEKLQKEVIRRNLCIGCGACVAVDQSGTANMARTRHGPVPRFTELSDLPDFVMEICPGKGIDYPRLYRSHYGRYPENWLTGIILGVRIGYSNDYGVRHSAASGGVLSEVLCFLLREKLIDAAIIVRQGIPEPQDASVWIARSREEIIAGAQSVYIPVSNLDILAQLQRGERYAMTCLPDQAAALRMLQQVGFEPAKQIRYVIGPYTGTSIYPGAIQTYLRQHGVRKDDPIVRLQWREGEWPGQLRIETRSGRVLTSKKVYYNFLTPFFITFQSLRSMDFANEFSDLAVGDAWSPGYEKKGHGFSVVVTRTPEMESLIARMTAEHILTSWEEPLESAVSMHGHMFDFKKRGSFIRNRFRSMVGKAAPDYGYVPVSVPLQRYLVEVVISFIMILCSNAFSRFILTLVPEAIIGPAFDRIRLSWKRISKQTKRKGLKEYHIRITGNG